MKKHILYIVASVLPVAGMAQTLSKEIVVDKDFAPELRSATRLNINPIVLRPTLTQSTLLTSERPITTEVPSMIATLEPAKMADADSLAKTQRGYAALGYFPIFNLGASAGYRIIDSKPTKLGVWGQYDGTSYRREGLDWDRNTATAAATLRQELTPKLALLAGANYTFASIGRPWAEDLPNQAISRFRLGAGVDGSVSNMLVNANLKLATTSFSKHEAWAGPDMRPITEIDFGFDGAAALRLGSDSRAGLRFDLDFNRYNHYNTYSYTPYGGMYMSPGGAETLGAVKFNPFWTMGVLKEMSLELGANVDFSVNSGTAVNLSPQCSLSWAPGGALNVIAMQVKATGGLVTNTLGSLIDYTPYTASAIAYGNSKVPYDLQATITIGPFSSAYLELSANYAKANDWLMPAVVEGVNLWKSGDIDGGMLSAKAGYAFNDLVEVSTTFQFSNSDGDDKGYYLWRDRARKVLDASVTVHPIKPLDVTLGFQARWGRRVASYTGLPLITPFDPSLDIDIDMIPASGPYHDLSLGAIRDLSLSGLYRLTDRWSVFLRCENLLNAKSMSIYGIADQGIHGLMGATYRF